MTLQRKTLEVFVSMIVWGLIATIGGCSCTNEMKDPQPPIPQILLPQTPNLESVLRMAVQKLDSFSDKETQLVLRVAARAFGRDGKEEAAGQLVQTHELLENGDWKFVAHWVQTIEFQLGPRMNHTQEITFTSADATTTGTLIDLSKAPTELQDIPARLKGASELTIAPNDPLQQVLTLSGFPDQIQITEKQWGGYTATIKTAEAVFFVKNSALVSAQRQKP
jgi:hypothetical protein